MRSHQGFTLVELSIVLVILGLLVGGVLTGQSLIHAAELRTVNTELDRYRTAINAFKDKYFGIPGDLANATSFWGAADPTPATCITTAGTGTQTCNGNGDGKNAPLGDGTQINEMFRFWQHLSNAGLIEGRYDGVQHGSTAYSQTAANTPSSKYPGGLWNGEYFGVVTGNTQGFDGSYGHTLGIGAPIANSTAGGGIFKPEDLWNIDTKIDDGMPATGKFVVGAPNGLNKCTDTSSSTNYAAKYLLTSTSTTDCNFAYVNVY